MSSKPLGATTYRVEVESFAPPTGNPTIEEKAGYVFVFTNGGQQEQRWLLQGWGGHKFLRPPYRSAGMKLIKEELQYGHEQPVTDLASWIEFVHENFVTTPASQASVYAKVKTLQKTFLDYNPHLPATFTYPAYPDPAPPELQVMQFDIGSLILRYEDEHADSWTVGYGLGAPDGVNQCREHWVLFPDGSSGGTSYTHGLVWPHDGDLQVGGTEVDVPEFSALMNVAPWQAGSEIILCSCRYYDDVDVAEHALLAARR